MMPGGDQHFEIGCSIKTPLPTWRGGKGCARRLKCFVLSYFARLARTSPFFEAAGRQSCMGWLKRIWAGDLPPEMAVLRKRRSGCEGSGDQLLRGFHSGFRDSIRLVEMKGIFCEWYSRPSAPLSCFQWNSWRWRHYRGNFAQRPSHRYP
jgi:hypothetical protein